LKVDKALQGASFGLNLLENYQAESVVENDEQTNIYLRLFRETKTVKLECK